MIFGFNTDVQYGDTVYHVQSEAREHELLLQTHVFVKGRCIGKRATSYAASRDLPGFSEQQLHEMLKAQHRYYITMAREGRMEAEFREEAKTAHAPDLRNDVDAVVSEPAPLAFILKPVSSVIGKGLSLECLPPTCSHDGAEVLVTITVTDESGPAEGAEVSCRITSGTGPASYAYAISGPSGLAEIAVTLDGLDLATASLLIRASLSGRSASRKYQLRQP